MIKLVAFDWNGTLIADTRYTFDCANLVFKRFGHKQISFKRYLETAQVPVMNLYLENGFTKEEFLKILPEAVKTFYDAYRERAKKVRTRFGVREATKYLKNKGVEGIIFSNHIEEDIEYHTKRLKLPLFILANKKWETPAVRGKENLLKLYLKQKKINPREVLIIGDSTEEVEIAKNLGCISTALEGGFNSKKRLLRAKPDYLISNLKELPEIIDAIENVIV